MGSHVERPPRALLFPVVASGHWGPFLQLILQLATKKLNFTLLADRGRCDELKAYQAKGAFATIDVEFLEVYTDPSTLSLRKDLVPAMWTNLESFISNGEFDPSRYTCMISDMFLYFCQDLADKWGIPNYFYVTCPTYFGLVLLHGEGIVDGGWIPQNPVKRKQFLDLPGLEMFTGGDMPMALTEMEPDLFHLLPRAIKGSAGLVFNSFEEFEKKPLSDLRDQLKLNAMPGKGPPTVFTIGPLLLLPGIPGALDDTKPVEKSESIAWLDKQQKSSVLFICFGSQRELPEPLITGIASGLEDTGVPFLWALRIPPQSSKIESLPEGFESRTQSRGLVLTSWVPQQEILLHPSVGGFLTHCGWNSILESMLGGVPIAAFPLYAEQRMNQRYMVNAVKTAVAIEGEHGQYEAKEIAAAIMRLLKGKEGVEARQNMQIMKEMAYAAMEEGGSSHKNLQNFLAEVQRVR
ncbi:hypothetical protein AXG93_1615s1310 [Marchantia polymorpha subsp. ruderalis]|uniref:Glycosyltransferase n=1 Tax=Marchantia polymorpha subsp. ruderalis TaxID=1480154 RepID=A0A176VUP2_MARPO|nr:hypothetical protein AXG93_1615s1310 [Marchantia polymorpha subsp. ruderalis]